jgi:hypothetical protein
MISDVGICNLALSHIGLGAIESLDEASPAADQCKTVFAAGRDAVLRSHPWNFATKRKALADLGTPPTDWLYRYEYPSDCLKARSILPLTQTDPPSPFETAIDASLSTRVLFCDQAAATLIYTAQIADPNMFDASFVRCFSWFLATEIAYPLTQNGQALQSAQQMYLSILPGAMTADAGEGRSADVQDPDWMKARG